MPERGRSIELTLDSMACGGDAVGRHQGQAVFVALGIPGERVVARVTESHRTYCRAEVEKVLEPSPDRVEPRCPLFGSCGGCQWQMIDYASQLEHKRKILAETIAKIGKVPVPEIGVIPHSSGWGYRNKAQFPAAATNRGLSLGFYQRQSHRLVEVERCPVLDPLLSAAWADIRRRAGGWRVEGYREKEHRGRLRHLVLRSSRHQESVMLSLVTRLPGGLEEVAASLPWAGSGVSGLHQNINRRPGNAILGDEWRCLWGERFQWHELGGEILRTSPGSFLQVNNEVAARVYSLIADGLELGGTERVLDLYSGVGSISLALAARAARVTGVEESEQAVEDAKAAAEKNGIDNCRFVAGDVGRELSRLDGCDAAVVDPPRQGLRPGVAEALARLSPVRLAYLSCDPATLARDLAALSAQGYVMTGLWMADMFPQTHHIEALAIMRKERS